jgi:hypothetical protein
LRVSRVIASAQSIKVRAMQEKTAMKGQQSIIGARMSHDELFVVPPFSGFSVPADVVAMAVTS